MMKSNQYGHSADIRAWLLAVFVLLSGCSGGISGTGDGGPIITVTNGESTLDTGADITPDGTTDGATAPTTAVPDSLPTQIYLTLPATLVGETFATSSVQSAYQPLRAAISRATSILLDAQVLVDLVATQFNTGVTQCDADANCIGELLDQSYLYSVNVLERDIQRRLALLDPQLPESDRLARETAIREQLGVNLNATIALTVSDYQSFFPTAAQQSIRISSAAATLDLTWRSDGASNLRYTRADIALHAKLDENQRFTLRLYDRQTATVLAAAFEPLADALLFEADLHRANDTQTQRYMRGYSDALSGTLLSRDPASTSEVQQRERYLSDGQLISAQTCADACTDTPVWTEQLSNAMDSTSQFESFEARFGQFEQTIADDIMIDNLDPSIDEWVVTSGERPDATGSTTLCSGQRVADDLRHFCFTAQLAASSAKVYREQLQVNGELVYTPVR